MKNNPELPSLVRNGRYDEALELLDRVRIERELRLPELVSKGIMIQVAPESQSRKLEDAKQAFEEALEIDGDYIPALLELASFLYMVEDDSTKALPLFEKAIRLTLGNLREAVLGKMKCLEDRDSLDAALSFLRQIGRECLDAESLENEMTK